MNEEAIALVEAARPASATRPWLGRVGLALVVLGYLAASALVDPDRVEVTLDAPAAGIAPGQAVVLYEGSRVVGSATIDRTGTAAGASPQEEQR